MRERCGDSSFKPSALARGSSRSSRQDEPPAAFVARRASWTHIRRLRAPPRPLLQEQAGRRTPAPQYQIQVKALPLQLR